MIRHNTLRHILTALLLFMAVIYGQTAFATTKTVTYTITEVQQVSSSLQVTITRSGDTPFEGGSTTYTMSVSNSSLGNGSGHYSVMLADGFQLIEQFGGFLVRAAKNPHGFFKRLYRQLPELLLRHQPPDDGI